MDALLRELRRGTDGIAEYRDVEVSAEVLTVGSAPDRTIQLLGERVAPQHAELRLVPDGLRIVCEHGCSVRVAGKEAATASLSTGDSCEFGANILTVVEAPAGFDIALQIEADTDIDASVFENAFRTDLAQGWLETRPAALTLSATVLLLAFLVPLLLATTSSSDSALRRFLPGDALWSSGPLHPAHALAIGDDCHSCHVGLFRRVQDAACEECHAAINDHVQVAAGTVPNEAVPRCATCHREHNEPDPYLVITADVLCTDCHAEPGDSPGSPGTAPVTGFSETAHPAFKASLLRPVSSHAGTGLVFSWETAIQPVSFASEVSNLKFPHDTHLDPELVTDPRDGEAIGCGDCHRLSQDNEHFVPITMESVCIDCHELSFDPQMPARQLPHGEPLEVMLTIEGQYLRKFSDPNVPQEAVVRRRIPDKDNSTRECVDTAFNCAAAAAADDIREQFSVRGCVSCHVVEEYEMSEIYARYQVRPVRLVQDFFPAGSFDHFSHQVMKEQVGDAACLECHAAKQSSESADLLIPDIDNCLGCHSDKPVAGRVTVRCVDCHAYHPSGTAHISATETD